MNTTRNTIFALALLAPAAAGATEPAFRGDVSALAEKNTDFRRVIFTGPNMQIVAMALRPSEEIGEEVHKVDQCFFIVEGTAQALVDGRESVLRQNGVLCVPAGTRHNLRNAGNEPLKLYTTYAPPQHPPGTVHHTKADAQRGEESPLPRRSR